jgi:hypothetical protein
LDRAFAAGTMPGTSGDSLFFASLDQAEAHAAAALAKDPASPFALEVRGSARAMRLQGPFLGNDSIASAAEADLSAAVAANPALANAWTRLAVLRQSRGAMGAELIAVERALQADPTLGFDLATRWFMLLSATWAGDRAVAERACDEGRIDFPDDRVFRECRLLLMSWIPGLAKAGLAWRDFQSMENGRPDYLDTRNLRLVYVAESLVQEGLPDSARAVMARATSLPLGTDSVSARLEAVRFYSLVGDPETATGRLAALLRGAPGVRGMVPRDPHLALLRGTPTFERLVDSLGLR